MRLIYPTLLASLTNTHSNVKLNTMLNINTIKSFTDLRQDPAGIAALAKQEDEVAIVSRSNLELVAMSPEAYFAREKLLDELQDRLDVLEIAEMKKNADESKFTTHDQLLKKLGV
mgnify:CR=1 FL=1